MKKNLITVSLLALGFALAVEALGVAAQGPTNTYPGGAIGADNQSHFIPAGAHLWYYFQYAGDNTQFSIVLVNGAKDNLDFSLYSPNQITLPNDYDSTKPLGRGSKSNIPCPVGQDTCDQQNNKGWLGNVTIAGRYYVEVINNTSEGKAFLLQINGPRDSVSLQPPTATLIPPAPVTSTSASRAAAPATPNALLTLMAQVAATLKAPLPGESPTASATATSAAPTTTSTPQAVATAATPTSVAAATPTVVVAAAPTATATPDNFYWTSAQWVYDNRLRVLPPKTDSWFKFEHSGDKSIATVQIPDAALSGLEFRVYTSDGASRFADEDKPVGIGTQPTVGCTDGKCTSNDLIWSGAFSKADTIYLRVTNTTEKYANMRLVVTGSGVVLGH